MRILFFSLLLITFGNCQSPIPAESRYQKLATAYCECTAQLVALNQQADTAQPAELNTYFQKMQVEYDKTKECATTIVAQFGHLKPAELDTLNEVLITRCPAVANNRDLLQELLGE